MTIQHGKSRCLHERIDEEGPKPFFHPVAKRIEDENRGAHGGVRYTETCLKCGASRDVLYNGRHVEYGSWEPSVSFEAIETDGNFSNG